MGQPKSNISLKLTRWPQTRIPTAMNDTNRPTAARAVSAWLRANGRSQGDLARALDVTPAAVSKWLRGYQLPPVWVRVALSRITDGDVPASMWMPEDQRERIGAAAARFMDAHGAADRGSK